jgi:hypothetical protein
MNKRIWITCLIILVSACVLIGVITFAGVGIYYWDQSNPQPTITAAHTVAIQPSATSCPVDSCLALTLDTAVTAVPTVELPKYIIRIMDQIQSEVIKIRGLHPTADIPRALLTPDQLSQNVIDDFLVDYTPEDANKDAILLFTIGLLPEEFNLISFYEDLYSEQIAGYYDDETKEMYIVSGSGFNGPEKMTYSHEFTHILQDQNYDLENGLKLNDEACKEDSERCAAISSLIEGDASLTEYKWYFQYSTDQDQADVQTFYEIYKSPVYDSSPEYMKEDFLFPYSAGQEFVQVLYDQGGWQAVNNAYINPPVSTEQIMHPSRYPEDTPVKVELPDLTSDLGEGWEQIDADVMGEWYTYLILAKGHQVDTQLDEETARKAAEGWGGDAFQIYHNATTNQTVFIIKTVWDTNLDAKEYYQAFLQYGDARWGSPVVQRTSLTDWNSNGQYAVIQYEGGSTRIIISPDQFVINGVLRNYPINYSP